MAPASRDSIPLLAEIRQLPLKGRRCHQPISPLVGEMSGRTEGGICRSPAFHDLHRISGPQRVPSGRPTV